MVSKLESQVTARLIIGVITSLCCLNEVHAQEENTTKRASVIYYTDLFLPYDDPDDHIDLATLYSLPAIDVKAVIIDYTMKETVERTGVDRVINFEAAKKAAILFDKPNVPVASGLRVRLKSLDDNMLNRPEEEQKGVNLIIKTLESLPDNEAILISTGSVRDFTAAFNRRPDLFRSKVKKFVISIGDSYGVTGTDDYNTFKDIEAWKGLMTSGLPIDWLPTNPSKVRGAPSRYTSYWYCLQSQLFEESAPEIQQFFNSENIIVNEERTRPMWSTAAFIETAGFKCYRIDGEIKWLAPNDTPSFRKAELLVPYSFIPITLTLNEEGVAQWKVANSEEASNMRIFRINDYYLYNEVMLKFMNDQFKRL